MPGTAGAGAAAGGDPGRARGSPGSEELLRERPVVGDGRVAVAERLQADVVGARVAVGLDRLGDRLSRAVRGSPRR